MSTHPGIRIDAIPAAGGGGLIFALGMVALFWLSVPELRPIMYACVAGGALLAPVLYRFRR
jgi:hypothetical protein